MQLPPCVVISPVRDFCKPIHAVQSNSPLSNYWLGNGERLRHGARSFPRRRAVHRAALCFAERGEAAIGRLRLSAKSRESRRDSSETRQSIVKMQVKRLRIIAHHRRSTEFCKGLVTTQDEDD